jgi:hypothetical protein
MASNLIQLIKKAAVEAVEASKPAAVLFGTVKTVSPLSVYLEQKKTITEDFIVLTDKINNLVIGDCVVMLRMQGGQRYVILDKVVDG